MEGSNPSLDSVERLRENLENNVAKLRKALSYWQTWEAEHEGLKEELQGLGKDASSKAMMDAGLELEGDVVNEQEMKELTGYGKGIARSRAQVISSINGRIETGRKNAQTVQKQLEAVEEQLSDLTLAAQSRDEEVGDGLPVMDIYEELDDDGNVISSQVTDTQDTAAQLDAISKRHAFTTQAESSSNETKETSTSANSTLPTAGSSITSLEGNSPRAPIPTPAQTRPTPTPAEGKKKVSFASQPEVSTFTSLPSHVEKSSTVFPNGSIPMERLVHPTKRILELDENDNVIGSRPMELVVPLAEDEALLHQQEAIRNMSDIGAVVAEMDLISPDDIDSDVDDEDDDYDDDDDESLDENDVGMTNIGAHITDDYKAQMEALMKKHEAAFKNMEGEPVLKPLKPTLGAANGTLSESNGSANAEPRTKRGVKFANDLDISPAPPAAPAVANAIASSSTPKVKGGQTPFSDSVIERVGPVVEPTSTPAPTKKLSKFKAARLGKEQS